MDLAAMQYRIPHLGIYNIPLILRLVGRYNAVRSGDCGLLLPDYERPEITTLDVNSSRNAEFHIGKHLVEYVYITCPIQVNSTTSIRCSV